MVYCGKPSRGCQMCRTRRIKGSYKDDFDLVFRNETQATERRARKAFNSKKTAAQVNFATQQSAFSMAAPPSDESNAEGSRTPIARNPKQEASGVLIPKGGLRPISTPIEVQAPSFFVNNFVIAPQFESRGYFDFLLPMLKSESPESHLQLAFNAVAMASLANRPNTRGHRQLFGQAVSQYTKALKATNLALQSAVHQKTDATLAAILMLGFFETVASERTSAMAWYSHVEGAVQLVKMRGKKQLRTKTGYSLFIAVRQQMLVSILSGSKPLTMGTAWWTTDTEKDEIGMFVVTINCRVAEMRFELNHVLSTSPRTPQYFEVVGDIMRRFQELERECQEWEARLPDEWRPRTVAWGDPIPGGDLTKAEVFPGRVDMYSDVTVANLWNQLRIARLFISGAIVRCAAWICAPVDYRTTPEYAQAVRLCGDLITDVITSTPYHLGWRVGQGGMIKSGEFSSFMAGDHGITSAKAIGGFFMMWPLFSISNTDYISDSQRVWAKGRLVFISEMLGLNHAKVLSNFYLRLPSMIIRRDIMISMASFPGTMPIAARGFSPPVAANPSLHITTATISKLANASGFSNNNIPQPPTFNGNQQTFNNTNSPQQQYSSHTKLPQSNAAFQNFNANQQFIDTTPAPHNYTTSQVQGQVLAPQNYTSDNSHAASSSNSAHASLDPEAQSSMPAVVGGNAHAEMATTPGYAPTPNLQQQQREAIIQENWEAERKMLLKKASNQQGESVERLVANYFVV